MDTSSQIVGLTLALLVLLGGVGYAVFRASGASDPGELLRRVWKGPFRWWLGGFVAALWLVFFGVFLWSSLIMIGVLFEQPRQTLDQQLDTRWTLLTITALTAGLSAVIALPFTLLRVKYTREQTEYDRTRTAVAEESFLTDRFNTAVEGLSTQQEVNRLGRNVSFVVNGERRTEFEWKDAPISLPKGSAERNDAEWTNIAMTEPNLAARTVAVLALEQIARQSVGQSRPDVHVQIMELLCAYVRENAPASEPDEGPKDWLRESEEEGPLGNEWEERENEYVRKLTSWLTGVAPRTDVQVTLEVLGRRTVRQREAEAHYGAVPGEGVIFDLAPTEAKLEDLNEWKEKCGTYRGYRLDLRATDLRGAVLSNLNFSGARLWGAQLQCAQLVEASLQGVDLGEASLQRADPRRARMQGANLSKARLEGAILNFAVLQGAEMYGAAMEGAFVLEAQLQGAALVRARLQGARLNRSQLQGARLLGAHLQAAELVGAHLERTGLDESRLQGAWLEGIVVDPETILTSASNRGSALRLTDYTDCVVEPKFFENAFGDGSVKGLPQGYVAGEPPLEHWARDELGDWAFTRAWRAWQVSIGYRKPDDSE